MRAVLSFVAAAVVTRDHPTARASSVPLRVSVGHPAVATHERSVSDDDDDETDEDEAADDDDESADDDDDDDDDAHDEKVCIDSLSILTAIFQVNLG